MYIVYIQNTTHNSTQKRGLHIPVHTVPDSFIVVVVGRADAGDHDGLSVATQ